MVAALPHNSADLYAQKPPILIEDLFPKSIGLDFNYLEIHYNLEESSHQLEPSVAPCLKEASTAHGDHSFGYMKFRTGKACHLWSFALYSDYGHRLFPLFLLSSEMIYSPHISSPASDNRRTPLPSWLSKVKLGFSPLDLVSILGLISQRKPKPITLSKTSKANISRSVFKTIMLSPIQCLSRLPLLHGRGLHERELTSLVNWHCIYSLRILVLASLRVLWFASKILKNFDLLISNRLCRSMNCGIGLRLVNVDTSSCSSSGVLKYLNLTTISLIQILGFKDHDGIYRRDQNLLLWVSKLSLFDYRTIVSQIIVIALSWVTHLTPLRSIALIPSSTSKMSIDYDYFNVLRFCRG
ncbi:unnamed protein product [Arabidopsis thaliana]|uniref:(thale cress) hypothetical protein n=1 Tax=Arabidopsis thaliana TaxID=3702 RepID=A0A7G2EYM0_ARATH|nr:unnamed protein product [Arabidopsis thaliana]